MFIQKFVHLSICVRQISFSGVQGLRRSLRRLFQLSLRHVLTHHDLLELVYEFEQCDVTLSLIFLDVTPECTPNVAQNRIVRRSLDHIEAVDGEADVVLTEELGGALSCHQIVKSGASFGVGFVSPFLLLIDLFPFQSCLRHEFFCVEILQRRFDLVRLLGAFECRAFLRAFSGCQSVSRLVELLP